LGTRRKTKGVFKPCQRLYRRVTCVAKYLDSFSFKKAFCEPES